MAVLLSVIFTMALYLKLLQPRGLPFPSPASLSYTKLPFQPQTIWVLSSTLDMFVFLLVTPILSASVTFILSSLIFSGLVSITHQLDIA